MIIYFQVRDRGGVPGKVVAGRASSTLRFGKTRLQPFLQSLLVALFGILEKPGYEFADNEYVMKAVMRVLGVAAETSAPFIAIALQKLVVVLTRVKVSQRNKPATSCTSLSLLPSFSFLSLSHTHLVLSPSRSLVSTSAEQPGQPDL